MRIVNKRNCPWLPYANDPNLHVICMNL